MTTGASITTVVSILTRLCSVIYAMCTVSKLPRLDHLEIVVGQ